MSGENGEPPLKRHRMYGTPAVAEQTDAVLEVPRHPYGVRPLGSALAGGSGSGSVCWDAVSSLGGLNCLYDVPLLHVLQALAALEGAHGLARLAQCSKAFYILTSHGPLWRPLVLARCVAPPAPPAPQHQRPFPPFPALPRPSLCPALFSPFLTFSPFSLPPPLCIHSVDWHALTCTCT